MDMQDKTEEVNEHSAESVETPPQPDQDVNDQITKKVLQSLEKASQHIIRAQSILKTLDPRSGLLAHMRQIQSATTELHGELDVFHDICETLHYDQPSPAQPVVTPGQQPEGFSVMMTNALTPVVSTSQPHEQLYALAV